MSSRSCASAFGLESPGLRRCSWSARWASSSAQAAAVSACALRALERSSAMARVVSSPKAASPRPRSAESRRRSLSSRMPRADSCRERFAESFISARNFVMNSGTAPLKVSWESFCASATISRISASKGFASISFPSAIFMQPARKSCSTFLTSSAVSAVHNTSDSFRTRIAGTFSKEYLPACSSLKTCKCVPSTLNVHTTTYRTPSNSLLKLQGSVEASKKSLSWNVCRSVFMHMGKRGNIEVSTISSVGCEQSPPKYSRSWDRFCDTVAECATNVLQSPCAFRRGFPYFLP
mmetsp:Transcript_122160/g.341927  ORF Transcript_122160/g.341927 Transcript_122160/m.341927 type:complete len:293 (-) Transcript_122160:730-1608(-)